MKAGKPKPPQADTQGICFQDDALSQGPVAYSCNPSNSGGRDQENCGSKPAQANSSVRPYLEKTFTKKGWWNGLRCSQGIGPEFKPQYHKKKKMMP
jgi:hypothetical protein